MSDDPFNATPEELKRLQEALESGDVEAISAFAASRKDALEAASHRELRLDLPVWEPGVKSRTVTEYPKIGRVVMTSYEPASSPPSDYPAAFPFFPDTTFGVTVTEATGEPVALMCMGLVDVEAAFELVIAYSAKDGWTFKPSKLKSPLGRSGMLERAGQKRLVTAMSMLGQSSLTVQQMPD